jgi:hypothetical protein
MRTNRLIERYFDVDEYGFAMVPPKYSNVRIARFMHGEEMGCSFCFPHGQDTHNSKYSKNRNNWKYHRKTQWRSS